MNPTITIELLPKTGDREDFALRVVGPGATDYESRLSLTRTVLTIWQVDAEDAARELSETLVRSHGTAEALAPEGFWFDSHNAAETVEETKNAILNRGWQQFAHPSTRTSLGATLFAVLDDLDTVYYQREGVPFLKALDILFEPSQALEDLESEAHDHAHFIYRVCILSGVVDRFNFSSSSGSLNGLENWLASSFDPAMAQRLVESFRMLKRLRKQYPIHESFAFNALGERARRAEIVDAEEFFGLGPNHAENWNRVLRRFTEDVRSLGDVIAGTAT